MVQIKQAAIEHELKRFMRPDAHKFIHSNWRRFATPGSALGSLYGRYERKFSPDQPRMPAGSAEGGQWTGGSGSSGREQSTKPGNTNTVPRNGAAAPNIRVAGRISPQRRVECEEQLRLDTFICNTVRTRSCWAQAEFRYSQCLIGGYVPPIYH